MSPDNSISTKEMETPTGFEEFKNAWGAFAHDLEIVKVQDRLQPQSPFSPPLPNFDSNGLHNYNLTILQDLDEEEVKSKLANTKIVAVGCMDWRFATALYEKAQKDGFKQDEIMLITVAGGMVQYGEGREKGLEAILGYVLENTPQVKTVIASGHANRCGAVATWTQAPDQKIHKNLGPHAGSHQEISNMGGLVIQGIREHLTIPRGKTLNIEPTLFKLSKPIEKDSREIHVEPITLHPDTEGLHLSAVIGD